MDDLEVCKRIAEIEYKENYTGMVEHEHDGICVVMVEYGLPLRTSYNPLIDNNLCFMLMVKYEVDVDFHYESVEIYNDLKTKPISFDSNGISVNKAICLAIIEDNKTTAFK